MAAQPPDMTPELFERRRARVLDALGDDGVMVLVAAPELVVGRDTELRYRVDPDLWYVTGYERPEAVAVLDPRAEASFTLFVRDRDPERERWTGPRMDVEEAGERFRADAAHPIAELGEQLPDRLKGADRIYYRLGSGAGPGGAGGAGSGSPGAEGGAEAIVLDALRRGRARRQRSGRGPAILADPGLILDDMRLVKEPAEVDAIRGAIGITVAAFREGLRAAAPGTGEWVVEAAVDGAFRRAGADGPAFATIAASGPNATVLHYTDNGRVMEAGDLLLLDAGAHHRMYAGDLTRTVPVGGELRGAQADVHALVHEAERAAIAAVRPGATTDDVHRAALRVLVPGMAGLGLLDPDAAHRLDDEQLDDDAPWKRWFPHKTSHWLGLDVHDVGSYALPGGPRPLEPGMVLTIEPGLYIPADADQAPAHLRGIGVRIEDDVLVTADGHEVLSAELPVAPVELLEP